MDRQIIYPGQIAVETDLLHTNRNTMISIGKLAGALFGTGGVTNGLVVGPSSPAALTVDVAPGEIYQLENVDNTDYSSLPADTTDAILKQGIMLAKQTLACAAPATAGYSINYLIQATYQDSDTGAVALPYYNASNPTQAYSGPNNTGATQATKRAGIVVVSAKAGTAATTGTQATPSPDSGYIALASVTVANGQATIVAGNITAIAPASPPTVDTSAIYADLASTSPSKGAALVGFLQSGTGAVARTAQGKLSEIERTPQDYGAAGDDTTDDTAAVQAWVNACQTYGYKGYVPAVASGYKLTAPISVTQGLQIYGDGCEPHTGAVPSTGTATRGRGSWFHFAHSGIGFNIDGGANGRTGVKLSNIATYRDQPAPTGGAYTPGVFDYDIVANTVDLTVEDVMLLNPTKGLSHTNGGYGRLTIRGLRGQPLSIGINVSESYDAGRVRDVHWWAFWSNDAGVRDYMRVNGIGFNIARWDNPFIDGCFALGYGYFVKLIQNANGHVNKLVMSNCDADVGGYLLFIDATVSGASVQMVNCRTQGQNAGSVPANFSNVQINGSNCRLVMSNTELRYPQASCVRVQGSGNVVQMSNMTLGAWNQAAGTYRAIDAATSGNTILIHNRPVVSEAGVSSTTLYNETSGSTVRAPVGSGGTSITTDAGGFATISHGGSNAPRSVICTPQGSTPYFVQPTGTFTATSFDVQVRGSGGAAASTATLTVYWRADY